MPIPTVAVDDPILADTMNALIQNVNGSPYRAVFTSSGSWTIPAGVNKYKVTLVGGGGSGGNPITTVLGEGDTSVTPGGQGGPAPMISGIFNAGSVGTDVVFTVGAGGLYAATGVGGSTSCNGLTSNGGGRGGAGGVLGPAGAAGSAAFPPGFPAIYHSNGMFSPGANSGYGLGGLSEGNGISGAVIIEW